MLTVILWVLLPIAAIGESDERKLAFGYKLVILYLLI